jgi:hypothetical protein
MTALTSKNVPVFDMITIDAETTEKRKKEIEELTKDLWE